MAFSSCWTTKNRIPSIEEISKNISPSINSVYLMVSFFFSLLFLCFEIFLWWSPCVDWDFYDFVLITFYCCSQFDRFYFSSLIFFPWNSRLHNSIQIAFRSSVLVFFPPLGIIYWFISWLRQLHSQLMNSFNWTKCRGETNCSHRAQRLLLYIRSRCFPLGLFICLFFGRAQLFFHSFK